MTTVGSVGDGAAVAAIRAAVGDTDAEAVSIAAEGVGRTDVAVLADDVGSSAFEAAAQRGRETETPLVCVELGGVGGIPVDGVEAAVSGYAPGTACHACLCDRVEAGAPETDEGAYDASTARFVGALAGRELAALLEGRESAVLGGVIEVPHARRRVLPVPYCACADRREGTDGLLDGVEPRSLQESIALAEAAFDERVGPIASVGEAESFPVPYYVAALADSPFSDGDAPDHAAGVGIDWDPAFMKALGEGLERYSAAVYRTAGLVSEPDRPIAPERFVSPDGGSDSVEHWHDAEPIGGGETVQVPAETAVFPPPERAVRPAITTGLGLGNDGGEAVRSGLYEVIERDAAMLAWYSTYEPMGLSVDDEAFDTLRARAGSEGLSVTALLLTQDIDVPVVGACVHRTGGWPRFAAGSDADLDPAAAARGALEEALQNWLELRRMGREDATETGGAIGTHAEFTEAGRRFVDPATTVPASSVGPTAPPEGRAVVPWLGERLADAGLDAYAARLTPRDVEGLGFEAARAIVPGAQPLFTGDPYFGERARSVPAALGFEPRLDRTYHPFP
ncbi:YcaO-like family protein [Natronomonas sp.]|uniref:YcaO-like family protein n=1 Tax=Natronomonas sp. TaxID=2184060 RepID=UPI00262C6F5C|nr:YcaO-like family protein [Natronomonas sp.]